MIDLIDFFLKIAIIFSIVMSIGMILSNNEYTFISLLISLILIILSIFKKRRDKHWMI